MFCTYKGGIGGKCGKYITSGDRCEKHFGKTEKKRPEKIKKFRGDSRWQKENQMFGNK